MLPLGTPAPLFELPDLLSGEMTGPEAFRASKALLVMFICRHCPYVKHVQHELAKIGRDYSRDDLGIIAISSNDADHYPDDAPDSLREMGRELKFSFPYCYDESQDVARSYAAACTPDFFLFNANQELAYRGRLDGSRPGNGVPVTGQDLRAAINALLQGRPVNPNQMPSLGCNIKWRTA
jgi:peroxiredoxin